MVSISCHRIIKITYILWPDSEGYSVTNIHGKKGYCILKINLWREAVLALSHKWLTRKKNNKGCINFQNLGSYLEISTNIQIFWVKVLIHQILKIIFLWGEGRRLLMFVHPDANPVIRAASQNSHVLSIPMLFKGVSSQDCIQALTHPHAISMCSSTKPHTCTDKSPCY